MADENHRGRRTDCFAYPKVTQTRCILKDWYSKEPGNRCLGCPFFKTKAQAEADKKKYPPIEEYKNRKG